MTVKISTIAANDLLTGLRAVLNNDDGSGGGFIAIFEGAQPDSPADAATGGLLATFTIDGDGSTGLIWDAADSGAINKPSGTVWSSTATGTGTAQWARVYCDGDTPTASSSTDTRVDMACTRTGSSECILSSTSIVTADQITIDSAEIVMPVS